MKKFDKPAAMRGARVCTRVGYPVKIICYDSLDPLYKIIACIEINGVEHIATYNEDGLYFSYRIRIDDNSDLDLMMADDKYQEKLERGEYDAPAWQEQGHIMTPAQIAAQPFASAADESYWRKMFAGMAMQGLCAVRGTTNSAGHIVHGAVECADALIEELKK